MSVLLPAMLEYLTNLQPLDLEGSVRPRTKFITANYRLEIENGWLSFYSRIRTTRYYSSVPLLALAREGVRVLSRDGVEYLLTVHGGLDALTLPRLPLAAYYR